MKKILLLILVIALAATLVACQTDKDTAPEELKEITIVLDWAPNTNHTGLYIAQSNGYYEEAGLSVSIVQPPEDGAPALVASGKADFGIDFQESLAMALSSSSPLPITAVSAIIDHNTSGILTLAKNNVQSPKDLEGLTYATWETPFEIAVMKQVVEADGGNFNNVVFVPATVTDVITALQTNVDAVWIYRAWDGIAADIAGIDYNYFAFADIAPVLDFYTPIIIANNDFLNDDPETAKAFLAATQKGYEYAISNPEEAAKEFVEAVPELDIKLVTASQIYLADQYKSNKATWGTFDEKRWNNFYLWIYEQGIVDVDLSGTGFTNDYLPKEEK